MEAMTPRYRYTALDYKGASIIFRLYDSSIKIENVELEEGILKHCMTLVGRQEVVYWLQNSPVEVNCGIKEIPFNPMAYKKVQIYAMPTKDFVEGFKYIYENMSMDAKFHLSGIVLNIHEWQDISGGEIVDTILLLQHYMALFHERFQDEEDRFRVIVHLPATSVVLDTLARLRPTIALV